MDTRNGNIGPIELLRQEQEFQQYVRPIELDNLTKRTRMLVERTGRAQISRNSPCPCGSRKRFKRCCMTDGK